MPCRSRSRPGRRVVRSRTRHPRRAGVRGPLDGGEPLVQLVAVGVGESPAAGGRQPPRLVADRDGVRGMARRAGQLGQDAHQPQRHGDVRLAIMADLAERDVQEPRERRAREQNPGAAVAVAERGERRTARRRPHQDPPELVDAGQGGRRVVDGRRDRLQRDVHDLQDPELDVQRHRARRADVEGVERGRLQRGRRPIRRRDLEEGRPLHDKLSHGAVDAHHGVSRPRGGQQAGFIDGADVARPHREHRHPARDRSGDVVRPRRRTVEGPGEDLVDDALGLAGDPVHDVAGLDPGGHVVDEVQQAGQAGDRQHDREDHRDRGDERLRLAPDRRQGQQAVGERADEQAERGLAHPVLDEGDQDARRELGRGERQDDQQDRVDHRDDRDHRAGDRPQDDVGRLGLGREEPIEEFAPGRDRRDSLLDRRQPDSQRGQGQRDRTRQEDEPAAQLADDMPQSDSTRSRHDVLPRIPVPKRHPSGHRSMAPAAGAPRTHREVYAGRDASRETSGSRPVTQDDPTHSPRVGRPLACFDRGQAA